MQTLRYIARRILSATLLLTTACNRSEVDSEPVQPQPAGKPVSVTIGCAGLGVEVESRTEMGGDGLSVNWISGDEIRLWAREAQADSFLEGIQGIPFRFSYYGPTKAQAGFSGMADLTPFDEAKQYDYFAIWAQTLEPTGEGTRYACTIPEVQNGTFDTQCDILTAAQLGGPALHPGEDNPYILLQFEHHIHLLNLEIPKLDWAADEKVRAVELIFPGNSVTGTITIDATGAQPDDLSGLNSNRVLIEFPKGEEKVSGDTFCAVIAPVTLTDGAIRLRIYGYTGYTEVDTEVLADRTFAASHATPMKLFVGPMTTTFDTFTLQIPVVDNYRPETAGENRFGVQTLGEQVQTIRLRGDGATAGLLGKGFNWSGCTIAEDTLEATVDPEAARSNGEVVCSAMFVLNNASYAAVYPWPEELVDPAQVAGADLQVEFESERAWVKSQQYTIGGTDYTTRVVVPLPQSLVPGTIRLELRVPYLFEEDFSTVTSFESDSEYGTSSTGNGKSYGPFLNGWSGGRIGGRAGTAVRLAARRETSVRYHARMDSAPIANLKAGVTATVQVQYDYGMDKWGGGLFSNSRSGGADVGQTVYYGGTANLSVLSNGETTFTTQVGTKTFSSNDILNEGNSGNGESGYNNISHKNETFLLPNCSNTMRLTWRAEVENKAGANNNTCWFYIDNVKVKLAE